MDIKPIVTLAVIIAILALGVGLLLSGAIDPVQLQRAEQIRVENEAQAAQSQLEIQRQQSELEYAEQLRQLQLEEEAKRLADERARDERRFQFWTQIGTWLSIFIGAAVILLAIGGTYRIVREAHFRYQAPIHTEAQAQITRGQVETNQAIRQIYHRIVQADRKLAQLQVLQKQSGNAELAAQVQNMMFEIALLKAQLATLEEV